MLDTDKKRNAMAEGENLYGTSLSVESMKVIAESIGISNLPDDAAKELSDDISYKLKVVIQVNRKTGIILKVKCYK